MRAKFVFEKFTEESDPVRDLKIGMENVIAEWIMEHDSYRFITSKGELGSFLGILAAHNKLDYMKYLINTGDKRYIEPNNMGFLGGGINGAWLGAISNKNLKTVKLIVSAGADLNHADSFPLVHLAGMNPENTGLYTEVFTDKDAKIMKYLLSAGAKPSNRALHWGIKYNNLQSVKILLEHGAKVRKTNIDMARRHKNKKMVELLQQYYRR
jgi:ankyrin repeat protein